jgi:sporulation protein YlmC with PRC-barrel domain
MKKALNAGGSIRMKQGVMGKSITTQSGADVGKVKDVIVDVDTKDVSIEVSKGILKRRELIHWSKIVSVGDRIIVSDDVISEVGQKLKDRFKVALSSDKAPVDEKAESETEDTKAEH